MEILNQGFDHVEYIVRQLGPIRSVFERMGFEKLGQRELPHEGTRSELYAQGFIRILLTEPLPGALDSSSTSSHAVDFLKKQDEGICVLALDVKSATQAFEETTARGAKPALTPCVYESAHGTVIRSEVWTPGQVRYAFIERRTKKGWEHPALFDQELVAARLESPSPLGLRVIDHLTNNVGIGEMKTWVEYYQKVFGFHVTRHFDINTNRTGLISDVVESPCGKIKVPINEATEPESQVQEFVNRMKGSGVQHLAFITTGLPRTLHHLREKKFKFLTVPHTYYEAVPTRVPGVTEDLKELESLGILLDGDSTGYLLQIFSEEILGPFFFEYIQRKGNQGFGEGNFKALFEAIERDQIKRGVLKA
jgi:4-hydroxyphenylpyruvate dioxygenase